MADKLEKIQILFQKRNARKRGPTSSDEYNDTIAEIAHDLAAFHDQWNNRLVSLTDNLPDGNQGVEALSVDAFTNGLDGSTLFVDSESSLTQNSRYFSAPANRPQTVLEQFQNVYNSITVVQEDLQNKISNEQPLASEIAILDSGGLFVSAHVESALAEVKNQVNNLTGLNFNVISEDVLPSQDNAYNIGSDAKRWNDLKLGPTSVHIISKVSDPGSPPARDYSLEIDSTSGNLNIKDTGVVVLEISNSNGLLIPSNIVANKMQQYLQVRTTGVGTVTGSVDENIFSTTDVGGVVSTDIDNGITWGGADGIATIAETGVYEITVVGLLTGNGLSTKYDILQNGTTTLYTGPSYIGSAIDPVERSINIIRALNQNDTIQCIMNHPAAGTVEVGSTMTIKRIA